MAFNDDKSVMYFENLGEDFDLFMSEYDVGRRLHLIFSVLLEGVELSGKKILEVGCGTGRTSKPIIEAHGELTVVDIGQKLVKNVSEKFGCVGFAADACDLPFEDGSFDVVISSECIEHTLAPCKALEEMCRVCRTGGFVCMTTPNKLWYPILWLSQKLKIRKFCGIENWIFPGQAKSVMAGLGFEVFKVAGCHLWPFQLKCSRPVLVWFDRYGKMLYPFMINFGIIGKKVEAG